jgi:hypothetical protein
MTTTRLAARRRGPTAIRCSSRSVVAVLRGCLIVAEPVTTSTLAGGRDRRRLGRGGRALRACFPDDKPTPPRPRREKPTNLPKTASRDEWAVAGKRLLASQSTSGICTYEGS